MTFAASAAFFTAFIIAMPPYRVLVGYQIREAILANYRPQHVVVPDVRIDVSFEDPTGKLGTAFMADPLLHQKMVNRIQQ